MPLYEYRCTACKKRATILTLRASEVVDPVCNHCGARTLERLMSRFAMGRSEEARLESLTDPSHLSGLDESDPASVARWMKRMSSEMGDEVGGGSEIDQMAEEMAAGGADSDDGDGSAPEDD